jgi:putative FmdB family regulatory protein
MPIYFYRASGEQSCDYCLDGFEKLQRLRDGSLVVCPRCSAGVEKVISATNLGSSKVSLGRDNLEKHGFTQYKKLEKGVYEKTAGNGPKVISDKE